MSETTNKESVINEGSVVSPCTIDPPPELPPPPPPPPEPLPPPAVLFESVMLLVVGPRKFVGLMQVLHPKPPVLKLIGRSSSRVPQALLLLEPITSVNVPPFEKNICDSQFFVYDCPSRVADWMYLFWSLSPDAMIVATAPVASLRIVIFGKYGRLSRYVSCPPTG
jgi:hypothetical protein